MFKEIIGKCFQKSSDDWRIQHPEVAKKLDEMELRLNNLEAKNGTKIIRQKSK